VILVAYKIVLLSFSIVVTMIIKLEIHLVIAVIVLNVKTSVMVSPVSDQRLLEFVHANLLRMLILSVIKSAEEVHLS